MTLPPIKSLQPVGVVSSADVGRNPRLLRRTGTAFAFIESHTV